MADETPTKRESNELVTDPKRAKRLERDLGLGVKKTEDPAPGMPADQGGGMTTEIGSTPPEMAPDRS